MHTNIRSSHPVVFCEKGVLEKFAKFTVKHLCQSFFLIKLQASSLQLYWKKYSGGGVFLWILLNKNTFFIEHNRWLFFDNSSFELSSVISKVFVADFEHVFVCWGRYRITIDVLRIIEKLYVANKSLLKVNNINPKTRCKIC